MLRSLRERRSLSMEEAAHLMGIERKTYSRFEAAQGVLDMERLALFADVTDSDPVALVSAVMFEAPDLAVASADAKLAMLSIAVLESALRAWGADARQLDAATFISTVEAAMEALGRELRARSAAANAVLAKTRPRNRNRG